MVELLADPGQKSAQTPLPSVVATVLHRSMDTRDARPEDAEEACRVMRRSISELCQADHRDDSTMIAAWLGNKTAETFAAWIRRVDASYFVAIERDAIAAVGGVTDRGEILLNYVSPDSRFRGASRALLAAMEARAADRGAIRCTLISTETARSFYLARGYAEIGAPVRKFGMDSGYPMAKALAQPTALPRPPEDV
jgi:GNAT superfamily N-acetyltransferase